MTQLLLERYGLMAYEGPISASLLRRASLAELEEQEARLAEIGMLPVVSF